MFRADVVVRPCDGVHRTGETDIHERCDGTSWRRSASGYTFTLAYALAYNTHRLRWGPSSTVQKQIPLLQ